MHYRISAWYTAWYIQNNVSRLAFKKGAAYEVAPFFIKPDFHNWGRFSIRAVLIATTTI